MAPTFLLPRSLPVLGPRSGPAAPQLLLGAAAARAPRALGHGEGAPGSSAQAEGPDKSGHFLATLNLVVLISKCTSKGNFFFAIVHF